MAITQAVCNSFKQEILEGVHDLENGGDTFQLALYTSAATLGAATTSYTTGSEVAASGQYAAGGGVLASQQVSLDTGVAIVDFADLSFTGVTLTARGALIYNTTETNKAVCVLDFGSDKTATSGTFTIQFPAFTSSSAILRIA
tara:strand:- start:11990 stop:12418 length:429 start_codon:yes stop_codon:yes gene_type:complete